MPKPLVTPAASLGRTNPSSSDQAPGTVSRRLRSVLETDNEDAANEARPTEQQNDNDFFSGLTGMWSPTLSGPESAPTEKQPMFRSRPRAKGPGVKTHEHSQEYLDMEGELKGESNSSDHRTELGSRRLTSNTEQFLKNASDITKEITKQLRRFEKTATAEINNTKERDATVTRKVLHANKDYSVPFLESMSSYQRTENGTSQMENVHVGQVVAQLSRQLASVEKEMVQLSREWENAQQEVEASMASLSGEAEHAGGSLEQIQEDVEKQADAAATEFYREMKACETVSYVLCTLLVRCDE